MDKLHTIPSTERVAVMRAVHQLIDKPIILDDGFAIQIIGADLARDLHSNVDNYVSQPEVRAFIVARSRYTEDQLALSIENGTQQFVILGAGLDTFAYRNAYSSEMLRIFEVDQPATQKWKEKRLKEGNIPIPDNLVFVPVDFEEQTLANALLNTSYDPNLPTFFSFLGVSYYLTHEALMEIFQFVSSHPAGSGIVFDYAVPVSLFPLNQQAEYKAFLNQTAAMGEPWLTLLSPAELSNILRSMRFNSIESMEKGSLNARYFSNRLDGFQVNIDVHLMNAHKFSL